MGERSTYFIFRPLHCLHWSHAPPFIRWIKDPLQRECGGQLGLPPSPHLWWERWDARLIKFRIKGILKQDKVYTIAIAPSSVLAHF